MHEAYNVSCIHIVSVLLLCDAPDIVVYNNESRAIDYCCTSSSSMTVLSIRLCRMKTMVSLKQLGHWMADIYFSSPLPLRIAIFHKR